MYQFNYQFLYPECGPIFTCIVPAEWLQKSLPTMGGVVVYVDQRGQMNAYTDYVFEFSDEVQKDSSLRTICLDIHCRKTTNGNNLSASHSRLFATPAKIHCATIEEGNASNDWCVEVVLLNHFHGCNASSAITGASYLDFDDIITVMSMSSEFVFEFGIGDTPQDILPGILERLGTSEAKCAFGMLFGKSGAVRLTHLDEMVNGLSSIEGDPLTIISDVGVDADKMLISVLVGR